MDRRQVVAVMQQALEHHNAGRLIEAERLYREILRADPNQPDALHLLGQVAIRCDALEQGIELTRRAIALNPTNNSYKVHLATALCAISNWQEAVEVLRAALQRKPRDYDVLLALGAILVDRGQPGPAAEYLNKCVKLKPSSADVRNNLGMMHMINGEYQAAEREFRRAIALNPGFTGAFDNLLFLRSYNVLGTPAQLLADHREWDRVFGAAGRAHAYVHSRQQPPGRKLKIGYVSPDFRRHAVGYFVEPLLREHDRSQYEIWCYAELEASDPVSHRLHLLVDGWRFTQNLDDRTLARRIHDDGIDILIDLAGHTKGNRLGAFTYKPAPVQATYLGYFSTTGLAAIDYWISDDVLHPAGSIEQSVEQVWRLPRCCLAIEPPAVAPPVSVRPAGEAVTFGSFNDLTKITPLTVERWSSILLQLPQSRLMMKARQLDDQGVCQRLQTQFAGHGIDAQRLILRGWSATQAEHLASYGEVDIALDSMPRTGGSTTMEGLWMGVPLVTLQGGRFIERLSSTMLEAIGHHELIASTPEDYITKAVALAGDPERLQRLRAGLRPLVQSSPLCDGRGLARALEQAYRDMWQGWLSGAAVGPHVDHHAG
ncbi:MAG: tetratricopeptide repeat protein [Gammaproteobacteria bacterium]|nr:tetratricopeptide repeat protein [Gammaproteobacteria bacterium]